MELNKLLEESLNKLEEFLVNYDRDQPLVLYGYGGGIMDMPQLFREQGIEVVAICDKDEKKQGLKYCSIPVMSFEAIKEGYTDFNVYITVSNYFDEIEKFLIEELGEKRVFAFGRKKNMDSEKYRNYLRTHEDVLVNIYKGLADERSRQTMEAVIQGTLTNDLHFFKGVAEECQYFLPDLVELSAQEVFVDAGAFDGDTIEAFLKAVKGQFKKIYAFEPDGDSLARLQRKNQEIGLSHKIEAIQAGVFSENGQLNFQSGAEKASHIESREHSTEKVSVICLDKYIQTDERVTFIKMDVEGCELQALKGAEQLIRRDRPKLAICIYHKQEDILEIPQFIQSLGMDYTYYMRHHSCSVDETVFYAV